MATASHPVSEIRGLKESIALIQAGCLQSLPDPLPRHQEIDKSSFSVAAKDDLVLSVSQTWHFQAHPDPIGEKRECLEQLVKMAEEIYQPRGKTLLFMDFLACPQRPFLPGQNPRSSAEDDVFSQALKLFPKQYLASDATLHLELNMDAPSNLDNATLEVPVADIRSSTLRQTNACVQIVHQTDKTSSAQPFCFIRKIGDRSINSLKDAEEALRETTIDNCSLWTPCMGGKVGSRDTATIETAPFGVQSKLPASVKGWIFLERFVSMVKIAMMQVDQASKVVFSNSPAILEEISQGGAKLREAALSGPETLARALKDFQAELRRKQFTAISLDKAENTGGMGGMKEAAESARLSDAEVVEQLMQELVDHLALHWQEEAQAQCQRQLVLSVSRSDLASVKAALASRANPNASDSLGMTSLHLAARCNSPEVVRALLASRADCAKQDIKGNCAAHEVTLLSRRETIELMDLLAPSEEILMLKSNSSISPANRFRTWVVTELGNSNFHAAQEWADKMQSRYPKAFQLCPTSSTSESNFHLHAAVRKTETYTGPDGRSFQVTVWEPAKFQETAAVHVLCLGLSFIVPPSSIEAAFAGVSKHVCERHNAKLFLLSCQALRPEFWRSATSFQEVWQEIQGMVAAMPLKDKFVLVDSSLGEATPLLLAWQDRLEASLVVNLRGFHSDDFDSGAAYKKIQTRFQTLQGWFEAKNSTNVVSLFGDYAWAQDHSRLAQSIKSFEHALQGSPECFWDHAAFHCRMIASDVMERTRAYTTSGVGAQLSAVVLLVGSFSPALWTQEAASRLSVLLPATKVEYLECSKSCWELEGHVQIAQVAESLSRLLDDRDLYCSV
eukprot:gb/GFBE01078038.1/.p1 GENE.gb/GFBE01078038.1/~~gb/GFBE01078038.1/.p1  ORF type:complete len:845 (+),score=145.25 gb/GFBE01078038.1/:1-2535(+)